MADPAVERERPPTTGSAATAPPQCADEIFLEGPRSRFGELFTLFACYWISSADFASSISSAHA
jgi:hypothetical protein